MKLVDDVFVSLLLTLNKVKKYLKDVSVEFEYLNSVD